MLVYLVYVWIRFTPHDSSCKVLWEKLEGPFVRELAKAIRSKNRAVFVHNCGDGPYFDSQIRVHGARHHIFCPIAR